MTFGVVIALIVLMCGVVNGITYTDDKVRAGNYF